jgi:hypothetical protein
MSPKCQTIGLPALGGAAGMGMDLVAALEQQPGEISAISGAGDECPLNHGVPAGIGSRPDALPGGAPFRSDHRTGACRVDLSVTMSDIPQPKPPWDNGAANRMANLSRRQAGIRRDWQRCGLPVF